MKSKDLLLWYLQSRNGSKVPVALSKAQKQILDKFNILVELQNWVALQFNEEGKPLGLGAPDFLMVMADLLHAAEVYLESQRAKLTHLQNPGEEVKASQEEWQVAITAQENVVKEAWLNATVFWRIMDQIITHPEEFGVSLQPNHIEYALQKKILPLIEMLKWTKPEFFSIPTPSMLNKLWAGLLGCLGGGLVGLWGGIRGGKRFAEKRFAAKPQAFLRPFLILGYSVIGLVTGFAMGASTGGREGFALGQVRSGIKLGYHAAYWNPFNNPIGSKNQQAFELRKLAVLFKLSKKSRVG